MALKGTGIILEVGQGYKLSMSVHFSPGPICMELLLSDQFKQLLLTPSYFFQYQETVEVRKDFIT